MTTVEDDGCLTGCGAGGWCLQARACGDVLVVGLIPDEEIIKVKGPPVMNNEERYVPFSLASFDTQTLRRGPPSQSAELPPTSSSPTYVHGTPTASIDAAWAEIGLVTSSWAGGVAADVRWWRA